jgi:DNA polymerase-3 subunit beta
MTTATKERKKTRLTGTALNAADLKAALHAVSPAVPSRSPKPILMNVRLGDGHLTASDGEVQIQFELPEWTGEALLLPHARLAAILNAATGDLVTLAAGDTSCTVSAGAGTWTLPTECVLEYPTWAVEGEKPITRLPCDQFARAVKGVNFATDDDSSRFALGAVLLDVVGEVVTFVATDGRRLSAVECEHDLAYDDSQTLVPSRVMAILERLAGVFKDASIQLEATPNELVATLSRSKPAVLIARVTARLVSGRFPKWRDVIPKVDVQPTTVLASDLLSATRAAAICTSEASKGVDFAFAANGIWLHGQSAEAGESSVTCPLVEFGIECAVKLDPIYVREWLTGLPADGEPTVSVQAIDFASAVVFRCDNHTGVVMPLAKD